MSGDTVQLNTIEDIKDDLHKFGTYDYVVFGLTLAICAVVGVYYAFRGKNKGNKNEEDEYLVGGRNMSVFPVALSLVASFISGIYLLGTPTEVYTYGTEYVFMLIPMVLTAIFSSYVFLPVFHNLQLSSAFEYFEIRFDKKVRLYGALLYTVYLIAWLPIVIYVPALAFNQVTGVDIHIVTPCVCIICIFYTCIGGLKAVVWTDFIQTWIMFAAMLVVIIKGTIDIGGWSVVWERSRQGDRIVMPSLDSDPTIRHSWLVLIIGGTFYWTQVQTLSQHMIQKYMTLPSLRNVRRALCVTVIGISIITLMVCYTGLLVYATYYDCDPVKTNLAQASDQLVPLLVMKVVGDYPGVPGLFVAGIFSAALSSLSSGLNSMSAVVLEDFVKSHTTKTLTSFQTGFIMRGSVIFFGALCVGLVFIVEKLGTVLQVTMSLGPITNGAMFGIFCCGTLLPWINAKGALAGGIVGLIVNGIVVIGAQEAIASGHLTFPTKPTTTEGCDYDYNSTSVTTNLLQANINDTEVFPLFKMSYLWYTTFGGLFTIGTAAVVSFFTGFTDLKTLNSKTIAWKFKDE